MDTPSTSSIKPSQTQDSFQSPTKTKTITNEKVYKQGKKWFNEDLMRMSGEAKTADTQKKTLPPKTLFG